MKRYFITGLIILLPLALTAAIVIFLFNLLTKPFLGIVKALFERYSLFESGFLFLNHEHIQNILAQVLIFISLAIIAMLLGFIAHWFLFTKLIKFAEYAFKKIPIVSTIYQTCQEIIKTLFASKNKSFKQVVLVPFPHPDSHTIGFITRDQISNLAGTSHKEMITCFVPTTPNPTSGFLMMFKQSDLIFLDMKVDDALKHIISCGLISAEFNIISKNEDKIETSVKELKTATI